MRVRLFEHDDAKLVLSWITSEREFRMWSADQYDNYPISPEDMLHYYCDKISQGPFYPLIFEEKGKPIGHMILRYPTSDQKLIRLGFIVLDNKKRGKGYGRQVVLEGMKYASMNLGAMKFNLGVFTNNYRAIKCYESIGFKSIKVKKNLYKFHDEEWDMQEMLYDPSVEIVNLAMEHIIKPFKGRV